MLGRSVGGTMTTITAMANDDGGGDDLLSTKDASRLLGITPRTLYRLIDEGQLPAYKVGRVLRLRRHEVIEFLRTMRFDP